MYNPKKCLVYEFIRGETSKPVTFCYLTIKQANSAKQVTAHIVRKVSFSPPLCAPMRVKTTACFVAPANSEKERLTA